MKIYIYTHTQQFSSANIFWASSTVHTVYLCVLCCEKEHVPAIAAINTRSLATAYYFPSRDINVRKKKTHSLFCSKLRSKLLFIYKIVTKYWYWRLL